jgi:hypothetical protein
MKAREWLERGASAADAFDAFSNYWRGFNNLFAGKGTERELISSFIRKRLDEKFAQDLLRTHPHEIDVLLSQPVVDMRGNGKDTAQSISDFSVGATAIEKLVALFGVIYQVRCNFEHGQKSPSRERDEALCKSACPFVEGVVRHAA